MRKRITNEQKFEKRIKRVLEDRQNKTITGCTFAGVKFEKEATQAIITIAEGLVENAKALGSLAHVLNASNVKIETLLKV